jgi:hypothetical protein
MPVTRLQLEIAQLSGVECRWSPRIAFAFAQQMPDDDRELPGRGDGGDMLTAAGADSQKVKIAMANLVYNMRRLVFLNRLVAA